MWGFIRAVGPISSRSAHFYKATADGLSVGLEMTDQKADLQKLQSAAGEVTQEACMRNVTKDIRDEEKADHAQQVADWKASQKTAAVENNLEEEIDDFDDDPVLRDLETRRRDALKARFSKEKDFHAQGHGEYREIVEDEFLKEVCGSVHVVVHFYHLEFFRCKIMDKHLKILAQQHLGCKFLHIDSAKAPFFVSKLAVVMLPTVVVFRDGKVEETLCGFEELGNKDDFRTAVLEKWLAEQGCIKLKKHSAAAHANGDCCDDSESDSGSGSDEE